jgi:ribonuclease R
MKAAARNRLKKKILHNVLDVFIKERNAVLNYKQVASRLGETDNQVKLIITEVLDELYRGKKLLKVDKGKYRLADMVSDLVEGVVDISRRGKAFFCSEQLAEDVVISDKNSVNFLNGDKVLAQIVKKGRVEKAHIQKVVFREDRLYAGIIEVSETYAFLHPDDPFMHVDVFVSQDRLKGAKDGDKVAVRISDWPESASSPFGEVVQVIGKPGLPDTEMKSILVEFGLPDAFPEKVQAEADRIPLKMSPKDMEGRKDMRDVCTFTIDPEDAKDFDDAISIQKLSNGLWEIGVHIADVSHYVKESSLLDQEASQRATSVYLADRVIPMLPEVLSNGLCSLRPLEDKLCFSVVFQMNEQGKINDYWVGRTIIHSDRRFTYEEAQERIETGKGDLQEEVNHLNSIARILRAKRMEHGSFDFSSSEVRFRYDEKGMPIEVYQKVMKEANQLVEEFMLSANQQVAQYIRKHKPLPAFIYRNHDVPNMEKLINLKGFVNGLGLKFNPMAQEVRAEINQLLKAAEGHPEEGLVQQMVIRSMAKADYGADNIGHYGLAFEDYSHFTSPIRRYPDVIAHRQIWSVINKHKGMPSERISVLAAHSSLMERKAVEAERASAKYMQALFLSTHVGKQFIGRVSGLTSFGMFVMLDENYCEGMVSLRSMDDDQYSYHQKDNTIRGSRHKEVFRLGDAVKVRVVSADALKRQIDFVLVD